MFGSRRGIGISACDVPAYPAGVYHQENIDWSRSQEFYCLMLETDFILPQTLRISDRQGTLLWLFSSINWEHHSPDKNEALLAHYIKALLLNLTKMGMEKLPAAERIEQYIRANFRERITAGEIARAAHVSESYACRIAQKRWGVSPMQLVPRSGWKKPNSYCWLRSRALRKSPGNAVFLLKNTSAGSFIGSLANAQPVPQREMICCAAGGAARPNFRAILPPCPQKPEKLIY